MSAGRDPQPSGPTPPAYESASLVRALHDERTVFEGLLTRGRSSGELRVANRAQAVAIEFAAQVDRHGNLGPTKTEGSARTVPIPRQLADIQGH